ncbi:unnamed protein product [Gordionus sp. m RMFG-2023]
MPSQAELLSLNLTPTDYLKVFMDNLLTTISSQAGLPLKDLESWSSQHLFEYGRKYYYKGSQVSNCLKCISRIHSEANQVIPSLNGDLSEYSPKEWHQLMKMTSLPFLISPLLLPGHGTNIKYQRC